MHEWGIASSILEKIVNAAKKNCLGAVTRVEIRLGRGLGIGKEEFLFCLKTITRDEESFKRCTFDIEMVDSNLASIESIESDEDS